MSNVKVIIQSLPSTGKTNALLQLQQAGLKCIDTDYLIGDNYNYIDDLLTAIASTNPDVILTNMWLGAYKSILLSDDSQYYMLMPRDVKAYLEQSEKDNILGSHVTEEKILSWIYDYSITNNVKLMEQNHLAIPSSVNDVDSLKVYLSSLEDHDSTLTGEITSLLKDKLNSEGAAQLFKNKSTGKWEGDLPYNKEDQPVETGVGVVNTDTTDEEKPLKHEDEEE